MQSRVAAKQLHALPPSTLSPPTTSVAASWRLASNELRCKIEIPNLSWSGNLVSWNFGPRHLTAVLNHKILHAFSLQSPGVAVIESTGTRTAARILNADGSIRANIPNPFTLEEGSEFYYFSYVDDRLKVVLAGTSRDYASMVGEATGLLSKPHEVR